MLQKDPKKRLSAHDLLKHDFLVKNVRQFKPLDVRKIPGAVQNGGILTVNAGAKNQANKLHETVWDIFVQPMPSSPQIPISNQQQYAVQGMGQPRMQMNQQPMYITPQMGVQQYYQQPGVNQNVYAYYK